MKSAGLKMICNDAFPFVLLFTAILMGFSTSSSHGSNSPSAREKRVLRCALTHSPPYEFVARRPNGTISWRGGTKSVVEWIAESLNVTLEYVYPSDEQIALRGLESSIDLVSIGEADFVTSGLGVSEARLKIVDMSTFFTWEDTYRMITPIPGHEDKLLSFIKPFDLNVWLLLVLSLLIVVKCMSLMSWINTRIQTSLSARNETSYVEYLQSYFMYSVNLLTNHGDYLRLTNVTSFLVCVTFWQIGASILVYSYSCIVVSSITVPTMKPAINSFEDVVASSEVSMLVRTDIVIRQRIMTSEVPVYKALREKALKNPKTIGNNMTLFGELLLTGKYAFPFFDTFVRFFIANEYKKNNGKCTNRKSKALRLSNSYFYQSFQKGSHLRREFSLQSMKLWETGQNRFWVYNELPKADVCFADVKTKNRAYQVPIKLVDLTSAFFILGIGIALSFFVFLIELLAHQKRLKKRSLALFK